VSLSLILILNVNYALWQYIFIKVLQIPVHKVPHRQPGRESLVVGLVLTSAAEISPNIKYKINK
jgi:hypothetical protein